MVSIGSQPSPNSDSISARSISRGLPLSNSYIEFPNNNNFNQPNSRPSDNYNNEQPSNPNYSIENPIIAPHSYDNKPISRNTPNSDTEPRITTRGAPNLTPNVFGLSSSPLSPNISNNRALTDIPRDCMDCMCQVCNQLIAVQLINCIN